MTAPVPQAAACPSRLCLDADDGTGHQVITLGCARADAHRMHYDEDRGLWWADVDELDGALTVKVDGTLAEEAAAEAAAQIREQFLRAVRGAAVPEQAAAPAPSLTIKVDGTLTEEAAAQIREQVRCAVLAARTSTAAHLIKLTRADAALAERERIRQLAAEHNARAEDGPYYGTPFADLITGGYDDHREVLADHVARLERLFADTRRQWTAALADHYLAGIECDPDRKLDNPVCGCSRVFLGWHPSIGAARQAWIEHVDSIVGLATVSETLRVSDRIAELGQLARDVLAAYLEVIGTDRPADIAAEIAQWEATLKGTP